MIHPINIKKRLIFDIKELTTERDQLKADLGDACEENGRIVDSSLKDIGALKAERDKLREQFKYEEERHYHYRRRYHVKRHELTKAKGAIEEVAIITGDHLEMDDAMVEIDAIVNKALTGLEDKS